MAPPTVATDFAPVTPPPPLQCTTTSQCVLYTGSIPSLLVQTRAPKTCGLRCQLPQENANSQSKPPDIVLPSLASTAGIASDRKRTASGDKLANLRSCCVTYPWACQWMRQTQAASTHLVAADISERLAQLISRRDVVLRDLDLGVCQLGHTPSRQLPHQKCQPRLICQGTKLRLELAVDRLHLLVLQCQLALPLHTHRIHNTQTRECRVHLIHAQGLNGQLGPPMAHLHSCRPCQSA